MYSRPMKPRNSCKQSRIQSGFCCWQFFPIGQLSAGRLAAVAGLPPGMVYKHLYKLVEIGML
ncbi:hypothetical protein AC244_29305 [Ensifer adhaerens]|uniref:Uncharacterized protein n=1 Tax=Ensifer adhaerens TaxID=106592 RepID=A0A0L8BH14_ENSAD|nr:hypothetical protein AC244_29305 [Ensifer adhaerens]